MTFIDRLVRPFQEAQGLPTPALRENHALKDFSYPAITYPRYLGRGVPPDSMADEFLSTYQVQATVYRCVRARSTNLMKLPTKVFRKISETEEEDISLRTELDVLLRKPNEFMTMSRFWEMTAGYLDLAGEEPWILERNGAGRLTAIYPLRPDKISPIPDRAKMIAGYVFEHEGERFTFAPEEVLFLRYFNPVSDFRGLTPMRAAQMDIELDLRAMAANRSMFLHGAKPGGIVTNKSDMSPEQWDRWIKLWNAEYSQDINQGKTIFLEGDARYERIGMTNEDMQYLEGRQWTADQVGEVYGVPPIYRMQFREASRLANADIQRTLFWDETMIPFAAMIADHVTTFLLSTILPIPNTYFMFDTSGVSALQPDREKQARIAERGFRAGALSPNQVGEMVFGLDPDPNEAMDTHYIPMNMIPIGSPPPEERGGLERSLESIDDVIQGLKGDEIEQTKDALGEITKRLESWGNKEAIIKGLASLERIRTRRIPPFTRIVRGLFEEQHQEILTKLRANKWHKQFDVTAVNFNVEEWVQRFDAAGRPEIALALEQAANDLAQSVGGTFDISGDVRASGYINYQGRQYAEMVVNTTYGKVDTILRGALASGISIGDTASLITEYFADNAAYRAERVARTEMVRAANVGRMHSMIANEFEWNMWVTQRDNNVRDSHQIDGEVVRIGDSFSTGDSYPQSVGERCFTIPQREGPA